jgi:hypothetical protein
MRSKIMQCTIRMIVALGIAVTGVIAIRDVVAYSSSVKRAWVIKKKTLTSPSRSPNSEGRVSAERISAARWTFFPKTATSVTASRSVGARARRVKASIQSRLGSVTGRAYRALRRGEPRQQGGRRGRALHCEIFDGASCRSNSVIRRCLLNVRIAAESRSRSALLR